MLVDSHVNLHAEPFVGEVDEVLARARAAGVGQFIAICARLSDIGAVRAICDQHPDVWPTLGAHPHHAKDRPDVTSHELIEMAHAAGAVAIGETGLDAHYNYSPMDDQIASFRAHIEAARATGLPLIVHTREADAATAEILEEEYARGAFKMLLHCYTGGADLAARAAVLGAVFSVNGIATFKNAQSVRDVIMKHMADDRIILETDSPYLAPAPHRGRRNEPAYLTHIADHLAQMRGWTRAQVEERTTQTFHRLFDRVPANVRAEP